MYRSQPNIYLNIERFVVLFTNLCPNKFKCAAKGTKSTQKYAYVQGIKR